MTVKPVFRLDQALRFPTISHEDPSKVDFPPFNDLCQFIEASYHFKVIQFYSDLIFGL
jgi:hypothetical protein